MYRRIALIPDHESMLKVSRWSREITNEIQAEFTLDEQHIPHVTVGFVEIEEKNIEKLVTIVKDIASQYQPITVDSSTLKKGGDSYIGLYFKNNEDIVDMRDDLETHLNDIVLDFTSFTNPHITLTRLMDAHKVQHALQIVKHRKLFRIKLGRIAICDTQEHGAISQIYENIPLK